MLRAMLLLALGWLVSGCASITAGTTQSVMVQTAPATAADCTLVNEKGTWHLPQNPGSTTVTKAYGDLVVTCHGKNGTKGSASVQSTTGGAVFGNIIAGGIIGAAVDMGSGAAYNYPSNIVVGMQSQAPEPITSGSTAPTALPASATAPTRLNADEAKTRLKMLQELREANSITEAEYQSRVKAIVDQL